jgi:uncharacterized membrane protein YfcA
VLLGLFGYPPVLASVTNTAGLTPGSISGAIGYRKELRGGTGDSEPPVRFHGALFLALIGGSAGSLLLMMMPPSMFSRAVPWLLSGACILIAISIQRKRITRVLGRLREKRGQEAVGRPAGRRHGHGRACWPPPSTAASSPPGRV